MSSERADDNSRRSISEPGKAPIEETPAASEPALESPAIKENQPLSRAQILRLQRTIGNQAVQRLLTRSTYTPQPVAPPVLHRAPLMEIAPEKEQEETPQAAAPESPQFTEPPPPPGAPGGTPPPPPG